MRSFVRVLAALALATTMLALLPVGAGAADARPGAGEVVVANRASGTISVIDVSSDQLIGTYSLPAGENRPEPMYVTYAEERVFVGDRANNRVVVFDSGDYSVVTSIPAGTGVFHQWSDPQGRQLWVNNDIDNTATVISPRTLAVVGTVAMPADLVEAGYKPHDVALDPSGRFAYVTLIGGADHDWLVQFNAATMQEVNRTQVGLDPHVSVHGPSKLIYVPAQNSDVVTVLNMYSLADVDEVAVPGAHGAAMAPNGRVFYTTNLPGAGTDGLFAIDTRTNTVIGSADTPYAVPHNLVVTNNNKVFVTHSGGTSDKVTVFSVAASHPIPQFVGELTVGLNPFGLAYVP